MLRKESEKRERYEREMEWMGKDNDRIQPLCGVHPKIAKSRMDHIFKLSTTREIFK